MPATILHTTLADIIFPLREEREFEILLTCKAFDLKISKAQYFDMLRPVLIEVDTPTSRFYECLNRLMDLGYKLP